VRDKEFVYFVTKGSHLVSVESDFKFLAGGVVWYSQVISTSE